MWVMAIASEYVFKRYQLTAFDQDYTITGVFNESQGIDGYQAKFSGLPDGQVINSVLRPDFEYACGPTRW